MPGGRGLPLFTARRRHPSGLRAGGRAAHKRRGRARQHSPRTAPEDRARGGRAAMGGVRPRRSALGQARGGPASRRARRGRIGDERAVARSRDCSCVPTRTRPCARWPPSRSARSSRPPAADMLLTTAARGQVGGGARARASRRSERLPPRCRRRGGAPQGARRGDPRGARRRTKAARAPTASSSLLGLTAVLRARPAGAGRARRALPLLDRRARPRRRRQHARAPARQGRAGQTPRAARD